MAGEGRARSPVMRVSTLPAAGAGGYRPSSPLAIAAPAQRPTILSLNSGGGDWPAGEDASLRGGAASQQVQPPKQVGGSRSSPPAVLPPLLHSPTHGGHFGFAVQQPRTPQEKTLAERARVRELTPAQAASAVGKIFLRGYLLGFGHKFVPKLIALLFVALRTRAGKRWSGVLRALAPRLGALSTSAHLHRWGIALGLLGAATQALEPVLGGHLLPSFLRADEDAYSSHMAAAQTQLNSPQQPMTPLVARGTSSASPRRYSSFFGNNVSGNSSLRPRRISLPWADTWRQYANVFCHYTPRYLAAALSSAAAILIVPQSSRSELALTAMVRALDALVGHWHLHHFKLRRRIPRVLKQNLDALAYMAATQVVMGAFFLSPELVPPAYFKWAKGASGMSDAAHEYIYRTGNGLPLQAGDVPRPLTSGTLARFAAGQLQPAAAACGALHPGETCGAHAVTRYQWAVRQTLPLYLAVHGVFPVLFSRRLALGGGFLGKTLRSASMLGVTFANFWVAFCALRQLSPATPFWNTHLQNLVGAAAIFIEPKQRRAEMALFIMPRALEILWRLWLKRGGVSLHSAGSALIFALSMGALLTQSKYEPETLRGSVRTLLRWWSRC